jgi:uncharacterized protein (DUF2461 family)
MDIEQLYNALLHEAQNSWTFPGFSKESLEFFDDFPESMDDSNEWWRSKKSVYDESLKPEFERFFASLINVISKFDAGIQTEPTQCIGRPTSQDKGKANPYRWGAIHSANSDKRIDVQFFLNLTSIGLRVGIYSGKHSLEPKAWKARQRKITSKKDQIFMIIKSLEEKGYSMHVTTGQDHANRTGGRMFQPSDAEDMLRFVIENSQLDVLKSIDLRNLSTREMMEQVLGAFVETRQLYQVLQPSSYSSYARNLL